MQQTNKLPDDKKGEIVGYLDKIEQLKQNKQAKEEGSSGYERNELNELRGNDPKIPTLKPSRHASLFDLPFPLGYRGLPDRAVRAALAWCDAKQVTDRIEVMWTVMVWVLDHFKMVKYLGPLYQKVRERERELWTDLTGSDDDPYCDECPGIHDA